MVEMKWVEDGNNIALFYRTITLESLLSGPSGSEILPPVEWTEWKKVGVEPKSKVFNA